MLIRPEQVEGAKGKNVIIVESRPKNVDDTILAREVVLEKTLDGRQSLKITVKASRPEGASKSSIRLKSACCPGATGQTGLPDRSDRSTLGPTQNIQAQMPGSGYLEGE